MQAETLERAKDLAARLGEKPEDLNVSLDEYLARLPESVVGIDVLSADADVASAMQMLLFGLKGVAAYADHAARLGQRDPELAAFVCKALVAGTLWDEEVRDLGGWLELVLDAARPICGPWNCWKGQYRILRRSRAHAGFPGAPQGQGHFGFRP